MKGVEILLLFLFLILNVGYILLNSKRYLYLINRRIQRMIFVLFSAVATGVLFAVRHDDIKQAELLTQDAINPVVFNIFVFWVIVFVVLFGWYCIFLSYHTIKSVIFKDTKITLDDAEQIKEITIKDEEDKRILIRIINTRNALIMNMHQYVEELDDFSHLMYIHIIGKYLYGKNGCKKYFMKYYFFNEMGLGHIKSDFKLTEYEIADIRTLFQKHKRECSAYSLGLTKNKYLVKIHTMYTEDDIILLINRKHFLQDEHIIIQSIISVLDLYVQLYIQSIYYDTD